jgi:radical SAM superfamily enzyme YgiQ (UPF0313 family)
MKILLVSINLNDYDLAEELIKEEIGILSICAFLRENNNDVKVVSTIGSEIDMEEVCSFNPELIAFNSYNQTKGSLYEIIDKVKNKLNGVYICIGGIMATYYYNELMDENHDIDFVIKGEGEYTLNELVNNLRVDKDYKTIKGLVFRDEIGNVIENIDRPMIDDLDSLPFPSRDIIERYNLRIPRIASSRGCNGNCSFCCSPNFWKSPSGCKWRGRSPALVVDEIEMLNKKHNKNVFFFTDNSFEDPGMGLDRMKTMLRGLNDIKLNIAYYASMRCDFYKKADEEILSLLSNSGLCEVFFGVESANEDDLKLYTKGITVQDINNTLNLFAKLDISIDIGFINFNPYSTIEKIKRNMDFLNMYGFVYVYLYLSKLEIYRGSNLYHKIIKDGLIKQENDIFDVLNYKFIDNDIEKLYGFMKNYVSVLNDECLLIGKSVSLYQYYKNYIAELTALFKHSDKDKDAYTLVREYKDSYNKLLFDLSSYSYKWIIKLIELVGSGWDEAEAMRISKNEFISEEINSIINKVKSERFKFFKDLASLHDRYRKFI